MASSGFGFMSNSTLKKLVEAQKAKNTIMQVMMADTMASIATDLQAIKHIVEQGSAASIFSIGDQIIDDWTESVSGTEYSVPHNVVSFENVELSDGESVPGMWLQWNYATALGMPFDAREAFYYAKDGLSAGTYSFTLGASWGKCVKGNMYEFTLENDVPAGGQLVFEANVQTSDPNGTNVNVYAFPTVTEGDTSALTTILETAQMSLVTSTTGVDLGEIGTTENGNLNVLARAVYGSSRWSTSGLRQYLNSSAGIGQWWSAQTNWDRAPEELLKYPGFMSGYDSAFLSAIQRVKVTTALNTVSDGGGSEDTYDYFFLPSLEQLYITPQSEGVEGSCFKYWKRAIGTAEPVSEINTAGVFPITYAINAKTNGQYVVLRSVNQGLAYTTWIINGAGSVGSNSAAGAYRCAPVCVVC